MIDEIECWSRVAWRRTPSQELPVKIPPLRWDSSSRNNQRRDQKLPRRCLAVAKLGSIRDASCDFAASSPLAEATVLIHWQRFGSVASSTDRDRVPGSDHCLLPWPLDEERWGSIVVARDIAVSPGVRRETQEIAWMGR